MRRDRWALLVGPGGHMTARNLTRPETESGRYGEWSRLPRGTGRPSDRWEVALTFRADPGEVSARVREAKLWALGAWGTA